MWFSCARPPLVNYSNDPVRRASSLTFSLLCRLRAEARFSERSYAPLVRLSWCVHEPPAGTVASATFESPLERLGCLSAPKMGKLPLGVTVTVTITPMRNEGDGAQ